MSTPSTDTKVDLYSGGPVTIEYIMGILEARKSGRKIQYKHLGCTVNNEWFDLYETKNPVALNWTHFTFRIDPSDKPKKAVPMTAKDLMEKGPVIWARSLEYKPLVIGLITGICDDYISINMFGNRSFSFLRESNFEYSTDLKTWYKFQKLVDE